MCLVDQALTLIEAFDASDNGPIFRWHTYGPRPWQTKRQWRRTPANDRQLEKEDFKEDPETVGLPWPNFGDLNFRVFDRGDDLLAKASLAGIIRQAAPTRAIIRQAAPTRASFNENTGIFKRKSRQVHADDAYEKLDPKKPIPNAINQPGAWHFFISHTQRDDSAKLMATELWAGFKKSFDAECWLDVQLPTRDMDAMKEGVRNSDTCICIVTNNGEDTSYFSRPMCRRGR